MPKRAGKFLDEPNVNNRLAEVQRLALAKHRRENWQRWGPYLSERQWGTVREDYSESADPWYYFPHDHARSRAYRWGEDGLLGICDRECRLCFSPAFWNGRDPIIKERLYGVPGPEGNHGEDVKECYYYLDSTPTHSYMKALYKYPQQRFPYEALADTNRRRSRMEPEYELMDTGIFDNDEYFDCFIEYAKAGPDDLFIEMTIHNRGKNEAALHVIPQLWFRNTWDWGPLPEDSAIVPSLTLQDEEFVAVEHETLGKFQFELTIASKAHKGSSIEWLFTNNVTNRLRHPGTPTSGEYFKDAFHEYIVKGNIKAVSPKKSGTKCGAHVMSIVRPDEPMVIRMRLSPVQDSQDFTCTPSRASSALMQRRRKEADLFYEDRIPNNLDDDEKDIARQAYGSLLWTKQFYFYVVDRWVGGDPTRAPMPDARKFGRNSDWPQLFNRDVISMPDKWEYPWYAAWDLAFHMIPMARVDMHFAKNQLILFLREWYMHSNGQMPAYEWALSDVNPPVHAWACWEVYRISGPKGGRDKEFLKRCFLKLLLNFTWWVNRKDTRGQNLFSGGFLGLDNIGVFDRNKPLPEGGELEQADGTAWMAFFCGHMLQIALELAEENQAYGDMASKFFEHYVSIAEAVNTLHGYGLWEDEDGFYYDHIYKDGKSIALKVRSLVGLMPLCTPVILYDDILSGLPGFQRRMKWFLENKPQLAEHITYLERVESCDGRPGMRLLAIPSMERFKRLLGYMLDENEFLSEFGIRSLSAIHRDHPFVFQSDGGTEKVSYVPGESDSYFFGGNSNWRGPIWFPINYLLIQSLRTYYEYYGDSFQVECPTRSGNMMNLRQVAEEIERRLIKLFQKDEGGAMPCHQSGDHENKYAECQHWSNLRLFYEYFHGDNGKGLGASHQTGWTALVATMLEHQSVCKAHDDSPVPVAEKMVEAGKSKTTA